MRKSSERSSRPLATKALQNLPSTPQEFLLLLPFLLLSPFVFSALYFRLPSYFCLPSGLLLSLQALLPFFFSTALLL